MWIHVKIEYLNSMCSKYYYVHDTDSLMEFLEEYDLIKKTGEDSRSTIEVVDSPPSNWIEKKIMFTEAEINITTEKLKLLKELRKKTTEFKL